MRGIAGSSMYNPRRIRIISPFETMRVNFALGEPYVVSLSMIIW